MDGISNTRTVEIIGGLSSRKKKEEAIVILADLWTQLLGCLTIIGECVNNITQDKQ